MTWRGPALDQDQADVVDLVEDVLDAALPETTEAADGDVARRVLGAAGVWSVGMPQACGGGGATEEIVGLVVGGLSRRSGGLAWACVQAHAAGLLLSRDPGWSDTAAEVASGALGVAVVHADQPGVTFDPTAGGGVRLAGLRVDVLGTLELLVVVHGEREAFVLRADRLETTATRTTGLQECTTLSVRADVPSRAWHSLTEGSNADDYWRMTAVGTLATAAGLVASASEHAESYARGRIQFGKPLTALASMREMLEAQRALAYELLARVLASSDFGTSELVVTSARAAVRAIDACADGLQAHGGYGYLEEYPAEALLRDAVSLHAASPVVRRAVSEGDGRLLGAGR